MPLPLLWCMRLFRVKKSFMRTMVMVGSSPNVRLMRLNVTLTMSTISETNSERRNRKKRVRTSAVTESLTWMHG